MNLKILPFIFFLTCASLFPQNITTIPLKLIHSFPVGNEINQIGFQINYASNERGFPGVFFLNGKLVVDDFVNNRFLELAENMELREVGSFENLESLETFRQHPAHQKIRNMIRAVGSWTVIDYEY